MSTPQVSVVVPAYNVASYVHECLASLRAQSLEDVEILVADDGSTDRTRAVVEAFDDPRIRTFHSNQNQGPAVARNRLLDAAKGEFVAFQDADDVALPRRLELQLAAFRADPELGLCGTFYETISARGTSIRSFRKPTTDADIRREIVRNIPFLCATLMVRRAALGDVRFRPFFNRIGCEDYDFAARIVERTGAANVPVVLYRARVLSTSFSRTRRSRIQVFADEIVRALARQRAVAGRDDLDLPDSSHLDALIEELDRPYREDPSLEFRRRAGAHASVGEQAAAVRAALHALKVRPACGANYRALAYVLRKALAG